ncbi:YhgE/Pip domain-containing protein [Shimazuella sp. AN120528]|uniref:YhgE/Pip domain-containing protein n=1 Tax=Shimazuella soli TaxID=1892854 RepID=UPI001F0D5F48|nr:YhgE/Pip domain-containing protein [Shimazuella soli]MCH5584761.1 YhgE/Pip domain-containing protein [Shimazuella soli]
MKLFQVFKDDLKHFVKNPMLMITFIAVACVPILYSGFLIKGTWDPYGKLENLPVAVVNLDKGAAYDGKELNVGKEFIDELKKNPKFAWKFVSQDEAKRGMVDNRYYAMITIPSNFSKNAASLNTDHPHQAEIQYESNSYYNFIAGQISENATKELRTRLSDNLTQAYTRSVFGQFTKISDGLQTAGKGATGIQKGADQLDDGLAKVSANLAKLSTGAVKIQESTKKLYDGSTGLVQGTGDLNKGASDLASGTKKLAGAGKQLEAGAKEAKTGSANLVNGIQASKQGTDRLTAGLQSSLKGSQQLEAGLSASSSSSKDLADGATQVSTGLQQMQLTHPELALDPNFQKLLAASKQVASGANQLSEGQSRLLAGSKSLTSAQEQLLSGSKQLSQGSNQLLQGAKKLQTGQQQLADGLHQYNTKFTDAVSGSQQLADGSKQLQLGAGKLHDGLGQLSSGSGSLVSGSQQLASGAKKLETGAGKLSNGSGELATKLNDAADQTSNIKADDKTIKLFSTPVSIKANDDRHISLYGYGIAPYFISLALFAGSLVFTTVFSARTSTTRKDATGWKLFVSKTLTFALMSLGQSLIACTTLIYALDLEVQNIPLFYGYTTLVAFTFMFFCQAMVTLFDQVGRFIILLVMIFQLASSAGTFPFELLPNWAKALNPWLPMTYSIRGFRDVISSGNFGDLQTEANHLLIFFVIFLALTIGYFFLKRPKRRKPTGNFVHV